MSIAAEQTFILDTSIYIYAVDVPKVLTSGSTVIIHYHCPRLLMHAGIYVYVTNELSEREIVFRSVWSGDLFDVGWRKVDVVLPDQYTYGPSYNNQNAFIGEAVSMIIVYLSFHSVFIVDSLFICVRFNLIWVVDLILI